MWNAPDTNSTNSILEYYNLYYFCYGTLNTTIIASTTDTYLEMEIGIIGEIWVTAIYSNPDGESEPSNVIINDDLPISVDENNLQNELNVFYDIKNQKIIIVNGEDNYIVNIFNAQGKLIKSEKRIKDGINIDHLQKGLYIIEILVENKEIKRIKIII